MSTPEEKQPQETPEQNEQTAPAEAPKVEMSEEDEAIVLQRLRELGYVD
ncbi:MAG: hypothetical protein JSR35_00210 [Proteobacteria bacterium]|nr:hypothetical protein [Pseudomonadota bacterium]